MRIGKILSVVVVAVASVIVLAAIVIGVRIFSPSRNSDQQNFPPAEGQKAISPVGESSVVSRSSGSSSFLYRKDPSNGKEVRLTSAAEGIESEASFSHDGKFVVYSFAPSADSKSGVWVVGVDGKNPHAVTGKDEDALYPVFSPDDSRVFYAASRFTGNHSPIVRPARHEWDVFSIPSQLKGLIAGVSETQVTHASFYDLQSLDVADDGVDSGGTKLLISTSGYPIGALLEEFIVGAKGRDKIFQPHVPGESTPGPAYGDARFFHGGMDVLFLAATDTKGGNYDYNVYSMDDTTGGEIKQLTHFKGMTTDLRIRPGERATVVNGGTVYVLDLDAQTVKPL